MAIRMRRGPYANMDPTKMIPGEWAVAIDSDTSKQVIWMCFAPGIVKRMGTYEDFKQQIADATEDIKTEYLEEFQAIIDQVEMLAEETGTNTDTVVQIRDNTVNTYLPQMLKYLENAAAASNTATLQAQAASTSASAAKVSEENTKSYMERAFSATPEGYDALVDHVNMLDIQTTTDATLYGSKSGGLRVNHMVGNTEQRTLSGKNRLNYDVWKNNTPVNCTAVYEYNGVTLTATADDAYTGFSSKYAKVEVSEGDTVIMSWEEETNTPGQVFLFPNGSVTASEYVVVSNDAAKKISYTVPSGITFITFRFGVATSGNTIAYKNIMIRINDDDPTFEPFCGAQPSPNPEYPQSINNVGDCVEMMQGMYNYATGIFENSSTTVCNKNSIPCTSGDTIKIEVEEGSSPVIIYYTNSAYLAYRTVSPANVIESIVPSGATRFNFYVYNKNGVTPENVGKVQLTINGKYVVQIRSHGKNFLPTGSILNAVRGKKVYINIPSGEYTVSAKVTSSDTDSTISLVEIVLVDGTTQYLTFTRNTRNSQRLTLLKDAVSFTFYASNNWVNSDGDTSSFEDIQIEAGTTATDFEECHESTATIYLNEPPREGDIIAEFEGVWKVERHSAEVVFDGSSDETWYLEQTCFMMFSFANKNDVKHTAISTHFVGQKSSVGWNVLANGKCQNYDNAIGFKKTDLTTVAEWKTWLQSNPITVQYKLATPTYEILDTASQIALNSLKTFDTITHIAVDSVTQPAELEVEFGKSKVGAYTLKSLNDNDIDRIERAEMKAQLNELATALVAVGSEV